MFGRRSRPMTSALDPQVPIQDRTGPVDMLVAEKAVGPDPG